MIYYFIYIALVKYRGTKGFTTNIEISEKQWAKGLLILGDMKVDQLVNTFTPADASHRVAKKRNRLK